MKVKTFLKYGLPLLAAISTIAFAKQLSLYEEPKATSKVVGSIDLSTGVIPIYSPENSEWVKIADPNNGNVGWIKSKELNPNETPSPVTYTQKTINNGGGSHTYQIVEYGKPERMNHHEAQKMFKQMQMRQRAIQEAMQREMQEMIHDMNMMASWHFQDFGYPLAMPIVIVPEKNHKNMLPPAAKPNTVNNKEIKSVDNRDNSVTTKQINTDLNKKPI